MSSDDLAPVAVLDNGYHELTSTQNSGAVDYVRSPHLVPRLPERIRKRLMFFFLGHLVRWIENIMLRRGYGWISSTGDRTLNALEAVLNTGVITKVYVYGEPFSDGDLGIHNIHQNQGDPAGTGWWYENGIWQDGATIIEKSDGTITAFINKFTSQSYVTDNQGHPV